MKCKCCLVHLHAIHILLLRHIKPIDSTPRQRGDDFPSEWLSMWGHRGYFPATSQRSDSGVQRSGEHWVFCSGTTVWELVRPECVCVCACAPNSELAGCGFPPCVSDPGMLSSLPFSLEYLGLILSHFSSSSPLFLFFYTCQSLCNLAAIQILTSVCPLSQHQWLASHQSSLQSPFAIVLSK